MNRGNFKLFSLKYFLLVYLAVDPRNAMPEPDTMTVVPDVSEINEAGWKCKVPSLLDTVFGGYSNLQVEKNLCRLNARSHHVEYVLVGTNVRTFFSSTTVVTKNRFTLSPHLQTS